jgi:signal transduction histidine kinase
LQRLTALVQHRLNNPLAALLAEAQLMSMDETLDAPQRASVERLIELVRRVIGIVRGLEEGAERQLS